jgi:hypothetical protein
VGLAWALDRLEALRLAEQARVDGAIDLLRTAIDTANGGDPYGRCEEAGCHHKIST